MSWNSGPCAGPPPGGLRPDEKAHLKQVTIDIMRDLMRLESQGARTPVEVGPFAQWQLILALQLASRHPGVTHAQRSQWVDIGHKLSASFTGEAQRIINMGWDPEFDE